MFYWEDMAGARCISLATGFFSKSWYAWRCRTFALQQNQHLELLQLAQGWKMIDVTEVSGSSNPCSSFFFFLSSLVSSLLQLCSAIIHNIFQVIISYWPAIRIKCLKEQMPKSFSTRNFRRALYTLPPQGIMWRLTLFLNCHTQNFLGNTPRASKNHWLQLLYLKGYSLWNRVVDPTWTNHSGSLSHHLRKSWHP